MPPKKAGAGKPRAASRYTVAPPLPENQILTDIGQKQWRLGALLAVGGFGRVHLASSVAGSVRSAVAKLELANNGPLFQEIHFYQRVARENLINEWKQQKGLVFLGVPVFLASGLHRHNAVDYRFLVIPRYGMDLESLRKSAGGHFPIGAVFRLAMTCLNVYEYLHRYNYVYADLKGENIMLEDCKVKSYGPNVRIWRSYVVDFGLAWCVPQKAVYQPDAKRAHSGTRAYTSLDAHAGAAPSFRGDIEILGYNILFWLLGKLPWSDSSSDLATFTKKQTFKDKLTVVLKELLGKFDVEVERSMKLFFGYAFQMNYADRSDFARLTSILEPLTKKAVVNSAAAAVAKDLTSPMSKKAKGNLRRQPISRVNKLINEHKDDKEEKVSPDKPKVKEEVVKPSSHLLVPGMMNFPNRTRESLRRRMSKMVHWKYGNKEKTETGHELPSTSKKSTALESNVIDYAAKLRRKYLKPRPSIVNTSANRLH